MGTTPIDPRPPQVAPDLTLPKLLVQQAARHGDRRVALREKEFGIWQSFTWEDYLRHVREFALGLVSLGLAPGDKVAIVGDNRPEWVFAELAALAAGGVPLGIYKDSTATEVGYVIDNSDAVVVVAEDQEQVDKLLELREKIPKVRHIVFADPKGMLGYRDPLLRSFGDVEALGRTLGQ